MPDYESMAQQDATHFTMRTVFAIGRMNGHVNLSMELSEACRPRQVGYRGQGIIAGSTLYFELGFRISPVNGVTAIQWSGEVRLNGPLALMAGDLLDTMSRQSFERMADSLKRTLENLAPPASAAQITPPDFDI
jgi:carbon monoxide dehydrogenase subunit G